MTTATGTTRTVNGRTDAGRLIRFGSVVVLGLSLIACGPRPDDTVLETPFSPRRRPRPPQTALSPRR